MASRARILLVSSFVADGSVGGRVAAYALERLGFAVTLVPTVVMPRHPGRGAVEPIVPTDAAFAGLLGAAAQAAPPTAVLSGYFASPGQVAQVEAFIRDIKTNTPEALYLCDPILGDGDRLYIGEDVATAIRDRLMPLADAATPNLFECRFLAGAGPGTPPLGAAMRLGPPTILVTSAPALLRGRIGNLLVTPGSTLLMEHRAVAGAPKGTGDLLAGLLLARRLEGRDWTGAAHLALAATCETVLVSDAAGSPDLTLVACGESLVAPRASVHRRHIAPAAATTAPRS